jgi:hypothetical protein
MVNLSQPNSTCRHYWIIETSQETWAKGHCQLCGATKDFVNSAIPAKDVTAKEVHEMMVGTLSSKVNNQHLGELRV